MDGELVDSFEPDMLVMADRNFYGYPLWRKAVETEASLLWRVTSTVQLPVVTTLADGSYLSVVFRPRSRSYHRAALIDAVRASESIHPAQALVVRVIEYDVPDREGSGKDEIIRLIATILDPHDIPAIELAAAYHERWEYEGLIDEVKTHQRGPARVLRSKSPQMVKQEVWALLLTHYCIRHLMCRAADEADVDPDRLSFIRSLRVIRRQVTNQADFPPSHFRQERAAAIDEILERCHKRRYRTNPRAVKRLRLPSQERQTRTSSPRPSTHHPPRTTRSRRLT